MICKLYRHFNAENELLYVGVSVSILARLDGHRTNSHWFDQIVKITIENFPTREEALSAEFNAIRLEFPKYNVRNSLSEYKNRFSENRSILTISMVAKRLNVTVNKLNYMILKGRFDLKPIPNMIPRYWKSHDVDAFLNRPGEHG